jgi:hypothetical protein
MLQGSFTACRIFIDEMKNDHVRLLENSLMIIRWSSCFKGRSQHVVFNEKGASHEETEDE